jgi:hypothetical protein
MNQTLKKTLRKENTARTAWLAFGGLLAFTVILMTVRELPSMVREAKLLRM